MCQYIRMSEIQAGAGHTNKHLEKPWAQQPQLGHVGGVHSLRTRMIKPLARTCNVYTLDVADTKLELRGQTFEWDSEKGSNQSAQEQCNLPGSLRGLFSTRSSA